MHKAILTSTSLACFKKCPRSYHYRYNHRLSSNKSSPPLRFGTAIHRGLELLASSPSAAIAQATAEYTVALTPGWASSYDWIIEGYKIQRLLHGYASHYSDFNKTIATELSLEMPIRNCLSKYKSRWAILAGKIDKIVQLSDGRLAIVEHKTTSSDINPNSDYWPRLRIDAQVSIYLSLARAAGYDVTTILYDVIRKPTTEPHLSTPDARRKYKADGTLYANMRDHDEEPNDYANRLSVDISARPEFYFARQEITRLDSDMQEFQEDLWQTQKLLSFCASNRFWPKSTAACIQPFKCEFCDLCFRNIKPAVGALPDGYKILENAHPELGENHYAVTATGLAQAAVNQGAAEDDAATRATRDIQTI